MRAAGRTLTVEELAQAAGPVTSTDPIPMVVIGPRGQRWQLLAVERTPNGVVLHMNDPHGDEAA